MPEVYNTLKSELSHCPERPQKEQVYMEDETHIWTYIPVSDFDVPSPPASDAARGAALRLWKPLQNIFNQSKRKLVSEQPQWDRPPLNLLRSISPDPNWSHAATQLANELGDDWFENRQSARLIHAFVAAPGVGIAETLQKLAQQRRLSVLTAPLPDSMFETSRSDTATRNAVDESSSEILVIPHLERWYLRHEDGLAMVRNLLERLRTLRKRVLLGCDSWGWAFLQQAIGIEDMLGEPQTLAPFDAKRLDRWFRSSFCFQRHEFRHSGTGELVFPDIPNAEELETSTAIASLAAKARGNPGVALALWRACLRTCDAAGDESAPPVSAAESVIWVVKLDDLAPPKLNVDVDRLHRFVLHSILLHGGLSQSSLYTILPFSPDDIQRRVSALQRANVLDEQDERLRVTLTAYPLVRRDLQNEGLLTDAF